MIRLVTDSIMMIRTVTESMRIYNTNCYRCDQDDTTNNKFDHMYRMMHNVTSTQMVTDSIRRTQTVTNSMRTIQKTIESIILILIVTGMAYAVVRCAGDSVAQLVGERRGGMRGKGHSGRWQLLGTQSSRESKIMMVYERKTRFMKTCRIFSMVCLSSESV